MSKTLHCGWNNVSSARSVTLHNQILQLYWVQCSDTAFWDIMGPLLTSSQDSKFTLVITYLFTKWMKAFPLKDTTATICRYGVTSSLHSNQGTSLCSNVVYSLCELLGIRTSAYHPEGNGQVERLKHTLESILAKTIDANQGTIGILSYVRLFTLTGLQFMKLQVSLHFLLILLALHSPQ